MKRIKTYLCATCENERLSALGLMHMHRDAPVNIDKVVDEFARLHPHRLSTFRHAVMNTLLGYIKHVM